MHTTNIDIEDELQKEALSHEVKLRSDRLMNYFLLGYFIIGLLFAYRYDTWLLACGVGGISLLAYYTVKFFLPDSTLYQYVLSAVLGIFMAQFIYQMHGLFEMHFFAFIGGVVLITYQNWKLQIPMFIVVVVHHIIFNTLQSAGFNNIYFTQLDYLDLDTFIIHLVLTTVIYFICGLWSFQLKKYSEIQVNNSMEMGRMQKEVLLHQERKKNEEALERSNQELMISQRNAEAAYMEAEKERKLAEKANQAKSIFLATMSHEIRTPMNGVIGMSTLLSETSLTEQQQQYVDTITSCGESLLNVINDILDFSKIESGKMDLDEHDFNLRNCIEEVLDVFGTKAAKSGIELLYEIDPKIPAHLIGDNLRLKQVITNLVNNAMKFTDHGEVVINVHLVEAYEDGRMKLDFKVTDSGIGIAADKTDRLFKAFSQVDASTTRKYGGTGLGLAISQKLVTLMNGEMAVDSEPGLGSTFSFTIITRPGCEQLRDDVSNKITDIEGSKILLIDDNQVNRLILKNQLNAWKLVPVLAESGVEALKILADVNDFDLILMDMQMPEMNGIQTAIAIKKQFKNLPVILLSSIGDEIDKNESKLFKSVLTKPIKHQLLFRHILASLGSPEASPEKKSQKNILRADFFSDFPIDILIAEDNLVNQEVIIHILGRLGYQPSVVNNGREAVEAVAKNNFDLVFMDMQMPEMGGVEATKIIREKSGHQPVIIAFTANTMKEDLKACIDAGMNDFLTKPLKLESLIKMLEKWAGQEA